MLADEAGAIRQDFAAQIELVVQQVRMLALVWCLNLCVRALSARAELVRNASSRGSEGGCDAHALRKHADKMACCRYSNVKRNASRHPKLRSKV